MSAMQQALLFGPSGPPAGGITPLLVNFDTIGLAEIGAYGISASGVTQITGGTGAGSTGTGYNGTNYGVGGLGTPMRFTIAPGTNYDRLVVGYAVSSQPFDLTVYSRPDPTNGNAVYTAVGNISAAGAGIVWTYNDSFAARMITAGFGPSACINYVESTGAGFIWWDEFTFSRSF